MMTRREWVQLCAAVAASPTVLAHAKPAKSVPGTEPLCAAVADRTSPDARAFGEAMAARAVPVHSIDQDLTDLYFKHLAPQWQQAPRAVAGLTRVAPLFCLERLAWDAGLRVAFLGRHQVVDGTRVRHVINGPEEAVETLCGSMRLLDWRIALADTFIEMPVEAAALRPLSAVRDATVAADPAFFSWVLAPVNSSTRSTRQVSL